MYKNFVFTTDLYNKSAVCIIFGIQAAPKKEAELSIFIDKKGEHVLLMLYINIHFRFNRLDQEYVYLMGSFTPSSARYTHCQEIIIL